ncbi:hypothetical protein CEXT_781841 [Caerostris extrusa]|uniref:Uncharacterized protein n=1 Tax=Caerostris extrusa TaxID=172846 RepID=A0AAV4VCL2_CAEEX|nr:hypothetical protein CEXT_781841 [Caerostris extrusa]
MEILHGDFESQDGTYVEYFLCISRVHYFDMELWHWPIASRFYDVFLSISMVFSRTGMVSLTGIWFLLVLGL